MHDLLSEPRRAAQEAVRRDASRVRVTKFLLVGRAANGRSAATALVCLLQLLLLAARSNLHSALACPKEKELEYLDDGPGHMTLGRRFIRTLHFVALAN